MRNLMREARQGRGRADERRGVERGRHPALSDERAVSAR